MSTSYINSLKFAGQQMSGYGGVIVMILGLVGAILNLLIFLTLRTFRQSSSAFYLIIMTLSNIGQLLSSQLTRSLSFLYPNNTYDSSPIYCKLRLYISTVCTMNSMACFCLATIDQYCGTSSYPKLRRICRIKFAAIFVSVSCICSILHGIPNIIFYYPNQSLNSSSAQCVSTNNIFSQYRSYFYFPVLVGFLPLTIIIIFGIMSLRNIKNMLYYTVPLIRQELDKQITSMILTQAIVCIVTILPYVIANILLKIVQNNGSSAIIQAQVDLSVQLTLIIYFIYFSCPFYIYVCTSERFRRQLIFVLFKICCSGCKLQQPQLPNNRTYPSSA